MNETIYCITLKPKNAPKIERTPHGVSYMDDFHETIIVSHESDRFYTGHIQGEHKPDSLWPKSCWEEVAR